MLFKKKRITLSQVTPLLLVKLRKQNPEGVFEIVVEDKKAFFRMPKSKELKRSVKKVMNGNPAQIGVQLLTDCFLAGDVELITDERFFEPALNQQWVFITEKIKKVLPQYSNLI